MLLIQSFKKENKKLVMEKKYRVNEGIRGIRETRLIDADSKMIGIVPFYEALRRSKEAGLDLVEITQGNPPVCKILNFGKFKYEQAKAAKEARKNQQIMDIKEVVLHPSTEENDILIRARQIKDWLSDNSKVRITVKMRGRERAHPEVAIGIINSLLSHCGPHQIEGTLKKEDRIVYCSILPSKS